MSTEFDALIAAVGAVSNMDERLVIWGALAEFISSEARLWQAQLWHAAMPAGQLCGSSGSSHEHLPGCSREVKPPF